ncbi:MAG: hypothetical protein PHY89_04900 [Candidatus Methanomethylophilaceae archaeon]|nr:hypothetical protein [Candidatus Methanomethylophilaceae archaeon]MDD3987310.1 hypothetical protein [Candidatus Methanomethylophilaceae archaeon]MDD4709585.1 hypothetical protein [Candidatus Methanomethylophilaceae archaeon]
MALGDAWGIKFTADKDQLMEMIFDEEDEDNQDMYDTLDEAIKKADVNAALIVEVIRANDSGYTISVDGGILIEVSVEYDDDIELDGDEYPLRAEASLKAVVVVQGLVNLDADFNITSVDVAIDAFIDAELSTNFSIMNYIDLMNDETGEMDISDVFTDTDNDSEIMAGASLRYSMSSTGGSGVTTVEDLNDVIYTLTLDGKQSMFASVFANIDGEIAEALMYMIPEDSDYEDFIIDEDTIQVSMTFGAYAVTDMEFSLLAEQNGDNGDGTFDYEFYIEDLYLTTEELSPDDLPFFDSLADIEVDPDFEYYLDSTEKSQVRSVFNKVLSAYNGSGSGLNFTVTYVVEEEETTQTVAFNKFVNPPAVPDKTVGDETMKCVGWMTEEGLEWNAGWGVKGDVTLYPIYAEEFTDVSELMTYMGAGTSGDPVYGHIRIDGADGLADFLSSGSFQFYGTLYVDVYDDEGNYLFSWTIFNDGSALDPDTVMDLNIVSEELTDEELEALSGHFLSGETSFLYIDFAASGLMPGKTTVTYNVGDKFADGTVLQIYFVVVDGDGNVIGLEPVRNATVVDGKVTFDLDHCSGYVLSAISVPDTADDDTMLYIAIAVAAVIIVAVVAFVLHRRAGRA